MKSRVASLRVGTFTICLRRKYPNRPLMSKRLKSPVTRMPQFGYSDSTRDRDWNRCSQIDRSSTLGGWYIAVTMIQENPWGRRLGRICSHRPTEKMPSVVLEWFHLHWWRNHFKSFPYVDYSQWRLKKWHHEHRSDLLSMVKIFG